MRVFINACVWWQHISLILTCVNLTHFELMSHSSEFTNLDRSGSLSVAPEVTKTLLVKDHPCKGKESFHVKTKETTFAV